MSVAPLGTDHAPQFLAGLNDEQRLAVTATEPAILVVAGPGSGKTRVIVQRIAYAASERQVPPERIVAVTFTNRAAEEMQARVQALHGSACRPRIGTFHWLCQAILRRHIGRVGRPRDFRLLTPREAAALLRASQVDLWPANAPRRELSAAVSAVKNGMDYDAAARQYGAGADSVRRLLTAYESRLRSAGALDLDDLLAQCALLLRECEDVRTRCAAAIAELLVDEYQDSNPVQQELLGLLRPASGSLVAVGDEDQAIYGWRQAGGGTVEAFRQRFPGARVVLLCSTYRCSRQILRAASALIAHNPDRTEKQLTASQPAGQRPVCHACADERDEAEWVAGRIAALQAAGRCSFDGIGVLYRTNSQSRAIEEALIWHDIPYRVRSGTRFYELPEIRALAAALRLALNGNDDEAAAYVLSQVPGVGEHRLASLTALAAGRGVSLRAVFAYPDLPLPSTTRAVVASLDSDLRRLEALRMRSVTETLDAAVELVHRLLPDRRTVPPDVDDPLDEVRTMVAESDPRALTLVALIDRMTLATASGGKCGVSLLTLHAAKGLEFDAVFLTGLEEGLLPHRRSLDSPAALAEERRLCYVGMTRARSLLFLSYARLRVLGGRALVGGATRFLGEIGPANLTLGSSPALRSRPRLHRVRPGERVIHPRWREGIVVEVEGYGRETMVTIDFGAGGTRRVQLCHAPLARLDVEDRHAAAG